MHADPSDAHPRLHVIVPACRVDAKLLSVLDGLDRLSPAPAGVTLADDGSPASEVSELAAERGHAATRAQGPTDPPRGPAAARNHAAASLPSSNADWLVFVDADVVPAADAMDRFAETIRRGPAELVAVLGAYDTDPPEPNVPSRYANLRHHFTHARNAGPASTFWAGLGAVRADAFRAVGGFDAAAYPRPSIEDIELGMRLHATGGTLIIDPAVRGTHLKRWTHRNLWRTEIRDRAWPWARLLRARRDTHRPLNLNRRQQASAAAAAVGLLFPPIFWLAECDFLRFFHARHTRRQTLHAALLHQAHFLYSATTFVAAKLWPQRPHPEAATGGREAREASERR